ncbi:GGDEF domain-containing protein [Sphingobium indicum]|uniref:diguanylate cyclase n=2 Tax=Sphingobium indicum TaxID=332055 RepID=A0A1L5BSU2_SPHIB|nr:GGDEF domain-containing protein [Sphingobium indicum]APL95961.1 diguanylate cyclase [Sphingobium indicum B90A]KEY99180.1 diguanylate cyclase [Sphingomonas sp. BHC-A]NYI22611.1 diguanylate cyclase [Sphingobium indicum]RYM02409.1 GGDEF domain-containing protein [Sphingobium indicum]
MTGASSSANAQHGLTDRLARWARGLSGKADDEAMDLPEQPQRARHGSASSREIIRRRKLYEDIGDFLFAHDLDLTPLNFGVAHDYLTGSHMGVEKAVKAVLTERGKITNGWVENVAAEQRNDEVTPEALASMLDKVEENLSQFTGLMTESRNSAKDYGAALQEEVKGLAAGSDSQPVLARLVALTRSMVEKTRQVETQLRDNQKQTQLLKSNLESARRAAEHDHLTGLPNRRAFEGTLREELAQAQKEGQPLAVAFCDIDHFKLINDTHGHDTGDRVLKFVAGLLSKASNDQCHVARHGGEEFVMLFRGKTAAEACEAVDGVRQDLSTRSLVNRSNGERMERVSFSAGVANVLAYEDPRAALKAADRALYLAKEHGRNRVYLAAELD